MSPQLEDLRTDPLQRDNLRCLVHADGDRTFSESAPTAFFMAQVQPAPCATEMFVRQRPTPAEDPLKLLRRQAKSEFGVGRLVSARAFSERRLALVRAQDGEASPDLPSSFCDLGAIVLEMGETEDAQWHFRQAAELLSRHGHTNTQESAAVHNNLGVTARRSGDFSRAREHFEEALVIKISIHGWEHRSVALTLVNLAHVEEMMGDLRSAGERYAHARLVAERTEGSLGPALAASLMGLGRIHYAKADEYAALFAFERALRIREAIICSPLQLAHARFAYALVLGASSATEACSLIDQAIREYQTTDTARSCVIERMQTLHAELAASRSLAA